MLARPLPISVTSLAVLVLRVFNTNSTLFCEMVLNKRPLLYAKSLANSSKSDEVFDPIKYPKVRSSRVRKRNLEMYSSLSSSKDWPSNKIIVQIDL